MLPISLRRGQLDERLQVFCRQAHRTLTRYSGSCRENIKVTTSLRFANTDLKSISLPTPRLSFIPVFPLSTASFQHEAALHSLFFSRCRDTSSHCVVHSRFTQPAACRSRQKILSPSQSSSGSSLAKDQRGTFRSRSLIALRLTLCGTYALTRAISGLPPLAPSKSRARGKGHLDFLIECLLTSAVGSPTRRDGASPVPPVTYRGTIEVYKSDGSLAGYIAATGKQYALYDYTNIATDKLIVSFSLPAGQTSGSGLNLLAEVGVWVRDACFMRV